MLLVRVSVKMSTRCVQIQFYLSFVVAVLCCGQQTSQLSRLQIDCRMRVALGRRPGNKHEDERAQVSSQVSGQVSDSLMVGGDLIGAPLEVRQRRRANKAFIDLLVAAKPLTTSKQLDCAH